MPLRSSLVALALLGALAAAPARAVEALDGRVELHGFAEVQVRSLSEDFAGDLDLAQWYNVLNLELEASLFDGVLGPLELVELFARVEVRYDCVWTRGCGLFPSANTFGDRAEKLPRRLSDGPDVDTTGAILRGNARLRQPEGELVSLANVDQFDTLAVINRAAFDLVFANNLDFRYTHLSQRGGKEFGFGVQRLGPWLPKNFVNPNADLADRVNPFDNALTYPVTGLPGAGALPYRPIPVNPPGQRAAAFPTPRGIYVPSPALRQAVQDDRFDTFPFNFRQAERAWNRGDSQQQTKELKELYLDIEMFEARLWLRIGRQSIVWGKTELFRTTDQLNPTDLALASLPSLEESRIPLWAARAVYSFWNVGPFSDVRAEIAVNIDEFQGNDLGACGEAFTVNLVCQLTFGGVGHGLTGAGIAGVDEPPAAWESLKGVEIGGRLEWRWQRFSFALIDFWGYNDVPFVRQLGVYERNVDPRTGRPRVYGSRGRCKTRRVGTTLAPRGIDCLLPGPTDRRPGSPTNDVALARVANNALFEHHANQQIFAMICATSIGFTALDPASCAQNVFGSQAPDPLTGLIPIGLILSGVVAGNPALHAAFAGALGIPGVPVVALTNDSALIGVAAAREEIAGAPVGSPEGIGGLGPNFGLSANLTPEQEALLGCGPFWNTNCDNQGIDLLNAEASALLQSFVGFEGTGPDPRYRIPLGAGGAPVGAPQPGHQGFAGGPFCTTGDIREDGRNRKLPGCRPNGSRSENGSTVNVGYLPAGVPLDGLIPYQGFGAQNPLHGQTFQSEIAAVSWNFMMLLVANSAGFNAAAPFSVAPRQCSYRQPQFCDVVQNLFNVAGLKRNTPRAGGSYRFGRRTFFWHAGSEVVLSYERRNVLGFSLDWAEDFTKSNWSVEFTWIDDVFLSDHSEEDGLTETDEFNLTISVDRPTFVNFLNANRTLLINSQWFFQYRPGYHQGITSNGPWNILATLSVQTGYLQDRLLPRFTAVYDFQSDSGALLPTIEYRFTAELSLAIGLNLFLGREQLVDMPLREIGVPLTRGGSVAYADPVENGLAPVRDRDELFFRLRYTF